MYFAFFFMEITLKVTLFNYDLHPYDAVKEED